MSRLCMFMSVSQAFFLVNSNDHSKTRVGKGTHCSAIEDSVVDRSTDVAALRFLRVVGCLALGKNPLGRKL
jgi:hypothetical protein